jgi:hypothetical protein
MFKHQKSPLVRGLFCIKPKIVIRKQKKEANEYYLHSSKGL